MTPDGDETTTSYTSSTFGAQYGLPLSTTAGAGSSTPLTTQTAYETPGTGYLRRTATTLPAGNATTYVYYGNTDTLGSTVCGQSASTPQGGALETQTDPAPGGSGAAREQMFAYDAAGRTIGRKVGTTATIANAAWSCTTYDPRGRILTQSWPALNGQPARTVTDSYAVGGNPLASSVSDTADSGATVSSTVDLLGRPVAYTDALGQASTFTYNQAGQNTSTTGPEGALTNGYSSQNGTLLTVSSGSTTLATTNYDYKTGQLVSVSYNAAQTASGYSYDGSGRTDYVLFTTSGNKVIAGDQTVISSAGRVQSDTQDTTGVTPKNTPAGVTTTYLYDPAGRLSSATAPTQTQTYGYSTNTKADNCAYPGEGANTNRTSVTTTPSSGSATTYDSCFNTADQLTSTSTTTGSAKAVVATSFAYDGQGNQTTDNGAMLTYDSSDRLIATKTAAGATTSYAYDALNRVISRTTSAGTTYTYYEGFTDSPAATSTGSGPITPLIPLPGGVLQTGLTNPIWSYSDLHGNYTSVSGLNGAAPTNSQYDPWGQASSNQANGNLGGSSDLGAFGADGKVTDATTGYVIMGARAYNPGEGRFSSPDPVFGGCANAYTYAFGDPVNSSDLSGQSTICATHSVTCKDLGLYCTLHVSPGEAAVIANDLTGETGGAVSTFGIGVACAKATEGLKVGALIVGAFCGTLGFIGGANLAKVFQMGADTDQLTNITFSIIDSGAGGYGFSTTYTPAVPCKP